MRIWHLLCLLPVCVELICKVEEVEVGDVTGGSRLNRFLLDKQQMFTWRIFGKSSFKQA